MQRCNRSHEGKSLNEFNALLLYLALDFFYSFRGNSQNCGHDGFDLSLVVKYMKRISATAIKPDRHLMRISEIMGYKSPESLCRTISEIVGDSLAVVDLVIWRYAVLSKNYENIF